MVFEMLFCYFFDFIIGFFFVVVDIDKVKSGFGLCEVECEIFEVVFIF